MSVTITVCVHGGVLRELPWTKYKEAVDLASLAHADSACPSPSLYLGLCLWGRTVLPVGSTSFLLPFSLPCRYLNLREIVAALILAGIPGPRVPGLKHAAVRCLCGPAHAGQPHVVHGEPRSKTYVVMSPWIQVVISREIASSFLSSI
jgi:hypothetical protein